MFTISLYTVHEHIILSKRNGTSKMNRTSFDFLGKGSVTEAAAVTNLRFILLMLFIN